MPHQLHVRASLMCDLMQLIRQYVRTSGQTCTVECYLDSRRVLCAEAQQLLFLSTDSHSDFQSEAVAGTPRNVMDTIKQDVEKSKVMLYMKVRDTILTVQTNTLGP